MTRLLDNETAIHPLLEVDRDVDHVDVYAINVAERTQRLLARVIRSSGEFEVHAPGPVEKEILSRIESSTVAPKGLDDLCHIFDSPQLMASRVHHGEQECAFRASGCVELRKRTPRLNLL